MPAPPLKTEISDAYPNPSNAVARAGFGKLWDYVTGLLGLTGNAADARTALGLLLGFAVSLSGGSRYVKMPTWLGGWIIQWGGVTTSSSGATVNFPVAFPNNCQAVFLTPQTSAGGIFATHLTQTLSAVYVQAWTNNTTQTAVLVEWFAIGY